MYTDGPRLTETRFSSQDPDEMYEIEGYRLFRNDDTSECSRPYHGTAIYFKLPMLSGYPHSQNADGIEFTIMKTVQCPDLIIIGIYKSPRVAISSLLGRSSRRSRRKSLFSSDCHLRFQC